MTDKILERWRHYNDLEICAMRSPATSWQSPSMACTVRGAARKHEGETIVTYFADLTSYAYWDKLCPDVQNVGWLDARHPFSSGSVPADVLEKLIKLGLRKTVNQARGFHDCELCGNERIELADGVEHCLLGSAEIWIPSQDGQRCFAAPDLIIHYIVEHAYRPPDAFLEALQALEVESWVPSPEMMARLESSQ